MRRNNWVRDGLVGAWCPSVSGWGGTLLRDLSGNGNHGTLTNMDPATDWVVNRGYYQLDFDGSNDQVNIQNVTVSGHYTIAFWVVVASLGGAANRGLFRTVNTGLWLNQSSGRYWGRHNGIDVANDFTGPLATVGALEHVVRSWDGNQAMLFFNGALHTSVSTATTTAWSFSAFGLQFTEYWIGGISDVRLHNRALTQTEIQQLYSGGPGYGLRPERRRKYFLPPTASYKNFLLWPYSLSSTKKAPAKNLPRYVKSSNRLMFPGG